VRFAAHEEDRCRPHARFALRSHLRDDGPEGGAQLHGGAVTEVLQAVLDADGRRPVESGRLVWAAAVVEMVGERDDVECVSLDVEIAVGCLSHS
jgi:hypothetical protein